MTDSSLDEVEFTCSTCRKKYLGKHIQNQWESVPICDWCAIPMMLREAGQTTTGGYWVTRGTIGKPETFVKEWVPERPLPQNPSDVN
jgi:hypothetical protein